MTDVYYAKTSKEYQDYYQTFKNYMTDYPEHLEIYLYSSDSEPIDIYYSDDSFFGLEGPSTALLKSMSIEEFVMIMCFPQDYSILTINKQQFGQTIADRLNQEVIEQGISDISYQVRVIANSIAQDQDKNEAHQSFAQNPFIKITETPSEKQTDLYFQFLTSENCIIASAGLEPGQHLALNKDFIINQILEVTETVYEGN